MRYLISIALVLVFGSHGYGNIFKQEKNVGPVERPALLKLPRFYSEKKAVPLVLLLHGRGNEANTTDLYLGLSRNQDQLGYALLLPNGTIRSSDGQRVWNATEECCGDNDDVDDSSYLIDLVKDVIATYNIDANQVFVMGHSNGGFMSYRLACDTDGLFKGLVSVAGSTFAEEVDCKTTTPLNVLQIHGTDDSIVPFKAEGKKYPGAEETVKRWADRNGCECFEENLNAKNLLFFGAEPGFDENGKPVLNGSLFDIKFKPETDELLYSDCADNTKVGLWRINGSDHVPVFIGRNVIKKSLEFVGYKK